MATRKKAARRHSPKKHEQELVGVREAGGDQTPEGPYGLPRSFFAASYNFLRPPMHVRTTEDAAQWVDEDLKNLIQIASQLADPQAFQVRCSGKEPARPATPELLGQILDDLYNATINLADLLRGRPLQANTEAPRITSKSFAMLLSEAEEVGLDEYASRRLLAMARFAAAEESRAPVREVARRAAKAVEAGAA